MKRLLLYLCLLPTLVFAQEDACKDTPVISLQGKIKKCIYYAPDNLFSFPVPELHNGGYVEDFYKRDLYEDITQGGVRFEDEVGTLVRVEFDKIPPHLLPKMCDQQFNDLILVNTFRVGIMTLIRSASPNAEILHEEIVCLAPNQHALFGIVLMPNGGTLVHSDCDRMNAARSYLITNVKGYIIYLSEQDLQFMNDENDACRTYKDKLKILLGEMVYYYSILSWCGS